MATLFGMEAYSGTFALLSVILLVLLAAGYMPFRCLMYTIAMIVVGSGATAQVGLAYEDALAICAALLLIRGGPMLFKKLLTLAATYPLALAFPVVSKILPKYTIDEANFFDCDGCGPEVAERRRGAIQKLSDAWKKKYPKCHEFSAELKKMISDLRFTSARCFPAFNAVVNDYLDPSMAVDRTDGIAPQPSSAVLHRCECKFKANTNLQRRTAPHRTAPHHTIAYHTMASDTRQHQNTPPHTKQCHIAPHHTIVRQSTPHRTIPSAGSGVDVVDLDGNSLMDISGSYGVNVCGYEMYKEFIETGWATASKQGLFLGSLDNTVLDNIGMLRKVSGQDEVMPPPTPAAMQLLCPCPLPNGAHLVGSDSSASDPQTGLRFRAHIHARRVPSSKGARTLGGTNRRTHSSFMATPPPPPGAHNVSTKNQRTDAV